MLIAVGTKKKEGRDLSERTHLQAAQLFHLVTQEVYEGAMKPNRSGDITNTLSNLVLLDQLASQVSRNLRFHFESEYNFLLLTSWLLPVCTA